MKRVMVDHGSAAEISLALFGSWLLSSGNMRATDITLEGHDLVLPGTAKITLIILRGGRE